MLRRGGRTAKAHEADGAPASSGRLTTEALVAAAMRSGRNIADLQWPGDCGRA
jgi:hypothetical protein